MLAFKPDYESSQQRMDAFWERELIDRPLVQMMVFKPLDELLPYPISTHPTDEARWLDVDYQARLAYATLANQVFAGDTLPIAMPNLGPDVFAALYGCPLRFGDYGTSWSQPILHDWAQAEALQMDEHSPYLHKLVELTEALLEIGRGKFITAMSDWHVGGDLLAALRGPINLAMDLIQHPGEVKTLLGRLESDYFRLYDLFYTRLRRADQPITTWLPLACRAGRYYVVSNDFSIMISNDMFRDFFLPGIQRECRFLDRSIYHLDGPGALRHLDCLLEIPELDALQFVPGVGQEGFHKWVPVYQKAQAAGKAIEVFAEPGEIDLITETLDPHGLYIHLEMPLPSLEAAQHIVTRLERWCVGKQLTGWGKSNSQDKGKAIHRMNRTRADKQDMTFDKTI
jgi:hypothetical protein